jgi:hypothetical protein
LLAVAAVVAVLHFQESLDLTAELDWDGDRLLDLLLMVELVVVVLLMDLAEVAVEAVLAEVLVDLMDLM